VYSKQASKQKKNSQQFLTRERQCFRIKTNEGEKRERGWKWRRRRDARANIATYVKKKRCCELRQKKEEGALTQKKAQKVCMSGWVLLS
jgi:hypothetical protein